MTANRLLTRNFKAFDPPGSRQSDRLSDGSTLEAIARVKTDAVAVSVPLCGVERHYERARPIVYGLREFRDTALDAHHTRIRWTYSFALRSDRFPGYLGALGRFLFEIGFVDRQYAELMKGVLEGVKKAAEQGK